MQQIVVIKINFIAAPAEIIMEAPSQSALRGNVGCQRSYREVISIHGSEWAVIAWVGGIEESIVVEIVATRRLALVVDARQQREIFGNFIQIVGVAAGNGAKLALPDEALSKI